MCCSACRTTLSQQVEIPRTLQVEGHRHTCLIRYAFIPPGGNNQPRTCQRATTQATVLTQPMGTSTPQNGRDAGKEQTQTWSSMAENLGGDATPLLASEEEL